MALANVNLKFGVNLKDFQTKLESMEKSVMKTGKSFTKMGKQMSKFITLPLLAIGAVSLKAASDAEETFSKFATVFRDVQGSAEVSFKILRDEYGLSGTAAKQLLGDTGDLLTGFGFTQSSALDLSTQVNKLAIDLASFTNFSGGAEGASSALTKALLGERDSLKSLGISILEEDVKKQVAINTAKGLIFETERQAKAQATLDLAIQQSGNAIGDYARTSGSFANQTRLMQSRLSDISVEIGKVFLPLATRIVTALTKVASWFASLSDTTKKTIVIIGALVASIGPLLVGLGFLMTTVLPALKVGFLAVSAAMSPLILKIAAIVAIVGGLILVGKGVVDSWGTISVFFGQMWERVKIMFIEGVSKTLAIFNKFTSAIGLDFSVLVASLENEARGMQAALDAEPVVTLGDVFSEVGSSIKNTFTSVKDSVIDSVKTATDSLDSLGGAATKAATLTLEGFSKIATIKNELVFKSWEDAADAYNKTLEESISLQNRISLGAEDVTQNVRFKGIGGDVMDLGNLAGDKAPMVEIPQIDESSKSNFIGSLSKFGNSVDSLIMGSISGAFMSLGQSVGEALASGANVFKAAGNSVLQSMGEFLGTLGKMLVEMGTMAIIKAKLESSMAIPGAGFVTGPMAIAAGVALIGLASALGSFASGKSGGGSAGGPIGMPTSVKGERAMGGTVQSNMPFLVGERGPEIFTPSGHGSITRNSGGTGGEQMIRVVVQGMLRGRDIHISGQEYLKVKGRTT